MNRDGYRYDLPRLAVFESVYNPEGNMPIVNEVEEVLMGMSGTGSMERVSVLITQDERLVDEAEMLRTEILAEQFLVEGNAKKIPEKTRFAEMLYYQALMDRGMNLLSGR